MNLLRANVKNERDFDFIDPAQVGNAAKWAAGGFALLAGLLGFFGVKAGILDRVVRTQQDQALVIVVLVGFGVVASVLAPAFKSTVQIAAAAPVLVVVGLGLLTMVAGWDDPSMLRFVVAVTGLVLVLVLAVVVKGRDVSLVAAALVVGIIATSMGLYGAAVLAVRLKGEPDTPRVLGTLEEAGGREVVKVVAKAAQREKKPLVVVVRGYPGDGVEGMSEVGRVTLTGDAAGDVDGTQAFPVRAAQWARLVVGYCADEKCAKVEETTTMRPQRTDPRVGAAVTAVRKDAVDATVTVATMPPTP